MSDGGMYVALSGMDAQEKLVDIISQNIANANTTGYKKLRPVFKLVVPAGGQGQAQAAAAASPDAGPLPSLNFSTLEKTSTDFTQGGIMHTGNPGDLAIEGEGFFQVETPQGVRYTRKGSFHVDQDGNLATTEGYPLLGAGGSIGLTGPDFSFSVDQTGDVSQGGQIAGKVSVVKFPDPSRLTRVGEGYFSCPDDPAPVDNSAIVQGSLEQSNVNIVKDLTDLIAAMRSYEGYQKYIKSSDDVTTKAVNELGRV